jgi:hypothetical protein
MESSQLQWTVDFGDGPRSAEIPHVWRHERPVEWEGPAFYCTNLTLKKGAPHLVFHGVSYGAKVSVNRQAVAFHHGIWDAFTVDLSPWAGQTIEIEVEVTKNGGPTFPVKQVASGFLPYVFQTFGGIFRPVELLERPPDLTPPAPAPRVQMAGGRIVAKGAPVYVRGVLTWGWYPEIGAPNPPLETIAREIDQIEAMGFNLVKFCLWLPPHAYLEELERRGLWAWLELPIWLPDPGALESMREECLRIVAQYRRHPNILAWTAGCELSEGIDPKFRQGLVEAIQNLTGHPVIKDNSGGAEMYGGHPLEFGTFDDFHPYAEPHFYSTVLQILADSPEPKRPTLLGEFNDADVYRPVHRWLDGPPYWASPDRNLNVQGVRWQYDLPRILRECDETDLGTWLEARSEDLQRSSLSQAVWMREVAFDATRLHGAFDGWVLTGHRHTPISSSGVIDDMGQPVFPLETVRAWTDDVRLMLYPRRTPPWVDGGNRPGWEPTTVRFAGVALFQVAVHATCPVEGVLHWSLAGQSGVCAPTKAEPLVPTKVGQVVLELEAGSYELVLQFGDSTRTFVVTVVEPLPDIDADLLSSPPATIARPFFREACYAWEHPIWATSGWRDNWDLLRLVASDRALDPKALADLDPCWQPLLVRLDTRTFERLPVVARVAGTITTSLRPEGGIGDQPMGIQRNPAGQALLRLFREPARV